jgi:hypothetical protein
LVKGFKCACGVLLLPVCIGLGQAVWRVLRASSEADTFWVATLAGAACWVTIYYFLPRPMWAYVLGHELTHAVWTWLFGGRVKRFKVSAKGGHVIVTRTNFLITLAPYFFPLYVVGIVAGFAFGHAVWGWERFLVWFHLLVGAAYAFHVTLTWHVLQTQQTDITEHGYLFSAVVIWLGNLMVLLLGVPLLTARVSVATGLRWWWEATAALIVAAGRLLRSFG